MKKKCTSNNAVKPFFPLVEPDLVKINATIKAEHLNKQIDWNSSLVIAVGQHRK